MATTPSGPKPQSRARLFSPGCSLQDQTPDAQVWVPTSPPPRHPQPRSSGFPARPRPLLGAGGGGVAFPGGAVGSVTRSRTLGQRADRQAPDAISGGSRLNAQFPFFPSTVGNGERGEGKGDRRHEPSTPGRELGDRSGWLPDCQNLELRE